MTRSTNINQNALVKAVVDRPAKERERRHTKMPELFHDAIVDSSGDIVLRPGDIAIPPPMSTIAFEPGDRLVCLKQGQSVVVVGNLTNPGGEPPGLDDLSDVSVASADTGSTLVYNGTTWVDDDPVPENHIRIGGVDYQASGSFGNLTSGSPPAFSGSSPVFYRNLTAARPYAPPTGYGFSVHILTTQRVNAISLLDPTTDPLTITQIQIANSNSGTFIVGWQLVKI